MYTYKSKPFLRDDEVTASDDGTYCKSLTDHSVRKESVSWIGSSVEPQVDASAKPSTSSVVTPESRRGLPPSPRWSTEENALLTRLKEEHPRGNWKLISETIKAEWGVTRSPNACAYHWSHTMKKSCPIPFKRAREDSPASFQTASKITRRALPANSTSSSPSVHSPSPPKSTPPSSLKPKAKMSFAVVIPPRPSSQKSYNARATPSETSKKLTKLKLKEAELLLEVHNENTTEPRKKDIVAELGEILDSIRRIGYEGLLRKD